MYLSNFNGKSTFILLIFQEYIVINYIYHGVVDLLNLFV
jgi:hypothetical protein